MSARRRLIRIPFWILAAMLQWIAAYFLTALLQIVVQVDADTLAGLVRLLVITWLADCAGIYLLGWLALRIRRPEGPRRLDLRLLLVVLGTLLPLLIPILVYRSPESLSPAAQQLYAAVPTPALAVLLGIIGFHLPGWLKAKPA